jgi:hypothetical protein
MVLSSVETTRVRVTACPLRTTRLLQLQRHVNQTLVSEAFEHVLLWILYASEKFTCIIYLGYARACIASITGTSK